LRAVLRRIFGFTGDEVTGGMKKWRNEDLHKVYSLRNVIRMIRSRLMRWAVMQHAWAARNCLGYTGSSEKQRGRLRVGFIWLRIRTGGGLL
jgi:hypothetical protein